MSEKKFFYQDDINVMTTDQGVMSGSIVFHIDDNRGLLCGYDFADSDDLHPVEISNESDDVTYEELKRKITQWYTNGEKPRDDNDNVIPFTF